MRTIQLYKVVSKDTLVKKFRLQVCMIASFFLMTLFSCSTKEFRSLQRQCRDRFLSLTYNHFEGGVLFPNEKVGLHVLWEASFKGGRAYKENLGFFVPGGLLILPNKENTPVSSKLTALPTKVKDNRLLVLFEGNYLPVLGIIHSHPDVYSLPMPAPTNDYQYCYLGIHNYVMDFSNLFDAYKDAEGNEVFDVLGPRHAYASIPLIFSKTENINPIVIHNAMVEDGNKGIVTPGNAEQRTLLSSKGY